MWTQSVIVQLSSLAQYEGENKKEREREAESTIEV